MSGRLELRGTAVAMAAVLLAGTSLGALFGAWRWLEPLALAVGAVAIGSLIARALRVPAVLQPFFAAAALVLVCTARFAGDQAFLRVLPTSAAWSSLRQDYSYGLHDVTASGPPLPATAGALLLVTIGVGLVALAVDLLAVGARHPSVAGVPLLALIAVPAASAGGGIGLVPFVLAGAGYLGLLALEAAERSARWGRTLTGAAPARPAAAGGAGWWISALSLGLALALPPAIPGANRSPFHGGGGGGGNSSTTVINPFTKIQTQLHDQATTTLLTVRGSATYQRLTALENFGSGGFTLRPLTASSDAKVSRGMPPPDTGSGTIATHEVKETVSAARGFTEKFLAVPQSATSVSVAGDWRLAEPTATVFSSRTTSSGLTWTATAAVPAPTAADLEAAGTPSAPSTPYSSALSVDLDVPGDLPSVVHDTAVAWAGGARSTYDITAAIQRHFTDGSFTYNLDAQVPGGPNGFETFLRDRQGYCEQFASTMVAMLRTMGIPARVAVGFTAGTPNPDGSYTITNRNAHAWPEVWLASAGWVRFEPTPLADGSAQVPAYSQSSGVPVPGGDTPTSGPSADPSTSSTPSASASASTDSGPTAGTTAGGRSGGSGGPPAPLLAGLSLLAAAAVAAAPRTLQILRRRRRWSAAGAVGPAAVARVAWEFLLQDAADRGVQVAGSSSPRATGRALVDAAPECAAHAAVLVAGIEQARYAAPAGRVVLAPEAGGPVDVTPVADGAPRRPAGARLRNAHRGVVDALDERLSWRRRARLAVLPPSAWLGIVTPMRSGLERVGRAMDATLGFVLRRGPVRGSS